MLTYFALCVSALLLAHAAPFVPYPVRIGNNTQIEAFVAENDGTGWAILSSGKVNFWAGNKLHPLTGTPLSVSFFNRKFLGDASRGYYLQLYDHARCAKRIYRLINAEARLHCRTLPCEPESDELYTNTYIARNGRVVNWNTRRLAVWQGDAWTFLSALVAKDAGMPVFMEHDERIVMVCALVAHVIHPDGRLTTWRFADTSPTYDCIPWHGTVAVRLARGKDAPEAFDMLSGETLPLPSAFGALREPVRRLMRASGGSVWAQTDSALYRLRESGATERLPIPGQGDFTVLAIDDPAPSLSGQPARPANDDWRVFFRDRSPGVAAWSPRGVVRWDERQGVRGVVTDVHVARDRLLWVIVSCQLFRIAFDESANEPPDVGGGTLWETYTLRAGTRLMDVGKELALFPETGNVLKRWNGTSWRDQSWPQALSNGVLRDAAWDNNGVVYLRHTSRIAPFDALTELCPDSAEMVSDAFVQDPFDKLWTALAKALDRGATVLNRAGWDITVTPEKKIWALDTGIGDLIHHFDGVAWRSVPISGQAAEVMVRTTGRVALRMRDGHVWVYDNGVFVETSERLAPRSDKTIMTDGLEGTPVAGHSIRARYTDCAGNLWFDLAYGSRAACCRLSSVRLAAQSYPVPGGSESLTIQATTIPLFTNATFAVRLGPTHNWQPLQTPSGNPACIRFPCSGVYTCEVAATVLGTQIPKTFRFEHRAEVSLPETRLTCAQDGQEPLIVTDAAWQPPVKAVPTAFVWRTVCQTMWRIVGSDREWEPLDADGCFPLRRLETNGVYQLEFAACEENAWRDLSPVTLTVRVALDDESLLWITLDNLGNDDPRVRCDAEQRLVQHRERWLPLLRRLHSQAISARQRLEVLSPVFEVMRAGTAD